MEPLLVFVAVGAIIIVAGLSIASLPPFHVGGPTIDRLVLVLSLMSGGALVAYGIVHEASPATIKTVTLPLWEQIPPECLGKRRTITLTTDYKIVGYGC